MIDSNLVNQLHYISTNEKAFEVAQKLATSDRVYKANYLIYTSNEINMIANKIVPKTNTYNVSSILSQVHSRSHPTNLHQKLFGYRPVQSSNESKELDRKILLFANEESDNNDNLISVLSNLSIEEKRLMLSKCEQRAMTNHQDMITKICVGTVGMGMKHIVDLTTDDPTKTADYLSNVIKSTTYKNSDGIGRNVMSLIERNPTTSKIAQSVLPFLSLGYGMWQAAH